MSSKHPLVYWLDLGARSLPVREIRGREAVSEPFRIEVRVAVEAGVLVPAELLKQPAVVRMERGGEHVRSITGVVTDAAASASVKGASQIRLVLEPPLALLRHRSDYRVFRDKTVPEIVTEVLAVAGVRPGSPEGPSGLELRLQHSYAKRPYCVQCRESDYDFVHRLLEDEGIHYAFAEQGGMVLGDSPSAYDTISGQVEVPFRGGVGMDQNEDAIVAVARRARTSIGKVSLRDFDLARPRLNLDAEAAGPSQGGPEFYDYPGEYSDPGEGARRAQLVAESYACAAEALTGESLCGRLVPGHVFAIEGSAGHGRHVVTSVTHRWKRDAGGFSCAFEAIDAGVTFRPPRTTPVPTLTNPLTGFVTGPAGEDIHTDELGHVKVHFPWDRTQPSDDRCSDWVPVLQDNTGHSIGIPRVGWEVLVHFLEGDPDRPVVMGRVYNAEDNFPNELPAGKTKTALKSLSSPGRGGTNQIEVDDLGGNEKVTIIAQRDEHVNVANDKTGKILHDKRKRIGVDETVAIGRDTSLWVGQDYAHRVARDQTLAVGGSRSRSVSGGETSTVDHDRKLTIGGMHFRRVGTDDSVKAKNLTETIGAIDLEAFVKTNTTTAGDLMTVTVGGAHIEATRKGKSESTKYARAETIGGIFFTRAKGQISSKTGKTRLLTVGGAMSVTSAKRLSITAGKKIAVKAGTGAIEGTESLTLQVGDSSVILADGAVTIASKKITFTMTGKGKLSSGEFALVPAAATSVDGGAGGQVVNASGGSAASLKDNLTAATKAGIDPAKRAGEPVAPLKACDVSVRRAIGTYNELTGLGIWQPPSNLRANDIVGSLDTMAAAYANATPEERARLLAAGQGVARLDGQGAQDAANAGRFVVAGLADDPSGHVTTVSPGDGATRRDYDPATGQYTDTSSFYPNVTGGGTNAAGRSDGTGTAGSVWSYRDQDGDGIPQRQQVGYYELLPPPPPPPPPPGTSA